MNIAESRDLDEDTVIDVDADGNIVAMTMEHASQRPDAPNLTFEEIAAWRPPGRSSRLAQNNSDRKALVLITGTLAS